MENIKAMTVALVIVVSFFFATMSFAGEIHDAVNNHDLTKVASLLKADPKLANAKDEEGNAPLELIAFEMRFSISLNSNAGGTASTLSPEKNSDLEIAKLLIANGAKINPEPGKTAVLLGALRGQNWPLAKLLIQKGAKVNVAMISGADKGLTPLHYASALGNVEIVKILLANKALVNAKDDRGNTPLHMAAWANFVEIGRVLIGAGANIRAKDNNGETPLVRATEYKSKEMVQFLKQSGAKE